MIVTALPGILFLQGCSGSQAQPTPAPPVSDPPKLACPAPISLQSPSGQPIPVQYGSATASGGASPVTITCIPPSGSTFSVGPTTVTCTAIDQRQRTDVCAFVVTVTAPPRISLTSFAAFGDSMTAGEIVSEGAGGIRILSVDPAKSWPADLQRNLARFYAGQTISVFNLGKSNETAPEGAARLSGALANGSYQALLLMEGANDIADRDSRTMQRALDAVRSMVQIAKGRGLKVFLATLPPQNPNGCCPNRGLSATMVVPYDDGLRAIAGSENVPLVDVYQAFGGDTTTLVDFDGLHPTAAGYQVIADTFFASIKQNLEQRPATVPVLTPFARRR